MPESREPRRLAISVERESGCLMVRCPYTREFVEFARMRAGRWSDDRKCWLFDVRDEFALRGMLIDAYGTDDYGSCPKVDVRVRPDIDQLKEGKRYFALGRELVHQKDARVLFGPGVVVAIGGFDPPYPRAYNLNPRPGTVLEVRGVPRALAERAHLEDPENVELLAAPRRADLVQERGRLMARVAEIDRLLESLDNAAAEGGGDDGGIIADLYDDPDGAPATGAGETAPH